MGYFRKEIEWAGRKLVLETGKIARQADGAVVVSYGDTVVLCTAVGAKSVKPGQDFFPLTVNYQEKTYAAGKVPGGFFRREGRPSEHEVLTSRLIDRPIRPLFPKNFLNEVQLTATVVSHDLENHADVLALIGCSAALTLSGIPFFGPVAAARVGRLDGKLVINPTVAELENSELDLVVAGTRDGVLMVESEASELSEDEMLEAVTAGHKACQEVIKAIIDLARVAAKDAWPLEEETAEHRALVEKVRKAGEKPFTAAYAIKEKQARQKALAEARTEILEALVEEGADADEVKSLFKGVEASLVRGNVLKTGQRIDGRDLVTVRPITAEVQALPRVHGSSVFTRGETQALVVATLGTTQDEQIIDALTGEYRSRFMLHYNFPPYSVGECGRMGSPGRREIGHGKLAWRAVNRMLPSKEDFPYSIRVVSEITESNGSSSMATVCGSSLALMDAGVPVKKPVAGIAMGLVKEGDEFAILTDIMGDEDHLGDMDFKVAGTDEGITALQMDIKITSITPEIMRKALAQAKEGRIHILGKMSEAMTEGRQEVSGNAPRLVTMEIPKKKIRDVIGSGGKTIREIVEYSGAKIDLNDDGIVTISAMNAEQVERARQRIHDITAEPEIGKVYDGTVVKTADFGAFVNFLGPKDGLVHISELTKGRVEKTTDVVKEGDKVKVVVLDFDDRGKVKLSMKNVDQKTGEVNEDAE